METTCAHGVPESWSLHPLLAMFVFPHGHGRRPTSLRRRLIYYHENPIVTDFKAHPHLSSLLLCTQQTHPVVASLFVLLPLQQKMMRMGSSMRYLLVIILPLLVFLYVFTAISKIHVALVGLVFIEHRYRHCHHPATMFLRLFIRPSTSCCLFHQRNLCSPMKHSPKK